MIATSGQGDREESLLALAPEKESHGGKPRDIGESYNRVCVEMFIAYLDPSAPLLKVRETHHQRHIKKDDMVWCCFAGRINLTLEMSSPQQFCGGQSRFVLVRHRRRGLHRWRAPDGELLALLLARFYFGVLIDLYLRGLK